MANHAHDAHHAAHAPNVDKPAALTGLAGGVVFLAVVVYTIVTLTNSHYAGEKHEGAPAGAAATAPH